MGIAPLQYLPGESTESLGLTGKESYTIELPDDLKPGQSLIVKVVYYSIYGTFYITLSYSNYESFSRGRLIFFCLLE